MKDLKNEELKCVNGGGVNIGVIAGIAAGITFIVGIIDGIIRPLKCN